MSTPIILGPILFNKHPNRMKPVVNDCRQKKSWFLSNEDNKHATAIFEQPVQKLVEFFEKEHRSLSVLVKLILSLSASAEKTPLWKVSTCTSETSQFNLNPFRSSLGPKVIIPKRVEKCSTHFFPLFVHFFLVKTAPNCKVWAERRNKNALWHHTLVRTYEKMIFLTKRTP